VTRSAEERLFRRRYLRTLLPYGGLAILGVLAGYASWRTQNATFLIVATISLCLTALIFLGYQMLTFQCPHCESPAVMSGISALFLDRYKFCDECGKAYFDDLVPRATTPEQLQRLEAQVLAAGIFSAVVYLQLPLALALVLGEWLPLHWLWISLAGALVGDSVARFLFNYWLRCPACRGCTPLGSSVYGRRFLRCRHCQFCGAMLVRTP
jgi:hypothetical protein